MSKADLQCALIGGSREATALARALADSEIRVVDCAPDQIGALEGVDAIVDASHPCEALTHEMIAAQANTSATPLLRFRRPAWVPTTRDTWHRVTTSEDARAALSPEWRRVFLCLGFRERAAFSHDVSRWYLVRARKSAPHAEPLANYTMTSKSGPFTAQSEAALIRAHRIDALVTRNAGGDGAFPKIEAARHLGLPVVLIERPVVACKEASGIDSVLDWLASLR